MESNKIAVIESKLPIKEYPEEKIDNVLKTVFKFWLASLLSIKADNENKLDLALTSIKKHFWSLGLNEVKKAFEMYANSELSIKPVSNHIDIILVGQIFKEYREQKPIPKKQIESPKMTEKEKNELLKAGVKRLYKEFEIYGGVMPGNLHLYDYLYNKGLLTKDVEEKKNLYNKAKENVKLKHESNTDPSERKSVKHILEMINSGNDQAIKNQYIIEAKRLSIEKFMEKVKDNDGLIDLYLEV